MKRILYFLASTALTNEGFSTEFTNEFQRAINQERTISARCLVIKRKYGNPLFTMKIQNGSIVIEKTLGKLITKIDEQTHGSIKLQRAFLLQELHENGCLLILKELNRYYHALSSKEFADAAKQSRRRPSALCVY
jgi:hypothetical protein